MLNRTEITAAIDRGNIAIDPLTPELIKRNSYVLRLGSKFRRLRSHEIIDIADPDSMSRNAGETFESDSVVIDSDSVVLASSFETISLAPNLAGVLSGISNVARLGTLVHATSAFINAGYGWGQPGRVVFEIATLGRLRVKLYTGIPICHLAIVRLAGAADYPSPSARTGQDWPGQSDLFAQFGHLIESAAPQEKGPLPG